MSYSCACLETEAGEGKENMLLNKKLIYCFMWICLSTGPYSLFCGILYNIPEVTIYIIEENFFDNLKGMITVMLCVYQ